MQARSMTALERFLDKVEFTEECWLWTAATNNRGYGVFGDRSYHLVLAHRWAYEWWIGSIPEGLTLDHLCRIPACVRPEHLEAVTGAENTQRAARYVVACPKGHGYDEVNTGFDRKGYRYYRQCARDRMRRVRS